MATGLKRLLAVSWAMPPMLYPRSIQVSRALSALRDHGWKITVICSDPKESGNIDMSLADLYSDCYEIIQIPMGKAQARGDALMSSWLKPAFKAVKKEIFQGEYSALITFAQPWVDHMVGLKARPLHIPWVVHFSDPWVDSIYYKNTSKIQLERWRRIERKVMQHADQIVFTNTQAVDLVFEKYPHEWKKKTHVIPHAFENNKFGLLETHLRNKQRLKMTYTGDLYKGRSAEKFLKAIALLSTTRPLEQELEIRIIGRISPDEKKMSHSLGLSGIVEFIDQLPYKQSLQECSLSDALLLIDAPMSTPSPFLPSKLVDYLGFRKPIFALTPNEGASAELLHRLGFSTVSPDVVSTIAAALNGFLDTWNAGLLTIPVQYDSVASQYSMINAGVQFNQVLDEAILNYSDKSWWQTWL